MSRWKRRVDRIKAEIPITQVLSDYGYHVRADGGDREEQFSCDLHGSGQDTKPSARVYPESASWYCFGCSMTRDAIATVSAKENLDFKDALRFLEKKYGLPDLGWADDDHRTPTPKAINEVYAILDKGKSFTDDVNFIRKSLTMMTIDRAVPMDTVLGLWEALDTVVAIVGQAEITEEKGRLALAKVTAKIDRVLFGEAS